MAGDPYCGKCHTWMSPRFTGPSAADIIWVCECPLYQEDMGPLVKALVSTRHPEQYVLVDLRGDFWEINWQGRWARAGDEKMERLKVALENRG